jgi:hypothetical protein
MTLSEPGPPVRRAAVVCRRPGTLKQLAQALGTAGIGFRPAVAPQLLPSAQLKEFDVAVVDLDVDVASSPESLAAATAAHCPDSPLVCIAGVHTRHRLLDALNHPQVCGIFPKLGSWIEAATPVPAGGIDEQELAVALRRVVAPEPLPEGPAGYLLGGASIAERVIGSGQERAQLMGELDALCERLGLSDEQQRRVRQVTEELVLNAIFEAPRDDAGAPKYAHHDRGEPLTLTAQEQVRVRWGTDGRALVVSVADRFGALDRRMVTSALARVLEYRSGAPDSAGVGLVTAFGASNQLVVQAARGRFTEVTAVIHIAGTTRASLLRGSSLLMLL